MATLRVRLEINKGRVGVPLVKLARVSEEFEKFLRMLGEDVGIESSIGDWIAIRIKDGSFECDAELAGRATTENLIASFNQSFEEISALTSNGSASLAQIRTVTMKQYVKMSKSIDADEKIIFGLYRNGPSEPDKWIDFTKKSAAELQAKIEKIIEYDGSIQGRIDNLNKGVTPPYFTLRDLSTGDRIKCVFPADKYGAVVEALQERNAVVHVFGKLKLIQAENKIDILMVERIEVAEKYQEGDIEKLRGIQPNLIGDMTTEQFINKIRSRGNG